MTTRRGFIQCGLAGMIALVLPKTAKAMPVDEPVVEPEYGIRVDGIDCYVWPDTHISDMDYWTWPEHWLDDDYIFSDDIDGLDHHNWQFHRAPPGRINNE